MTIDAYMLRWVRLPNLLRLAKALGLDLRPTPTESEDRFHARAARAVAKAIIVDMVTAAAKERG
jgi:hypothetical protein